MFARRMFSGRYFAPRYFPPVPGDVVVGPFVGSGRRPDPPSDLFDDEELFFVVL